MAALSLQLRAKGRILQNTTFIRLFSSSSSSSSDGGGDSKESQSQSQSPPSPLSSSSPFSEVRASLRQSPPATPRRLLQTPPPLDSIPSNATKSSSFDEIRKNFLSQYSAKTAPPQTPPHPTSFKELYDRNVVRKGGGGGGGVASFESIKNSLKLIRESKPEQNKGGVDPLSLQVFKESLQMKPHANIPGRSSPVLFGSSQTPLPKRDLKATKSEGSKNYLLRAYKYEELGERLRKLRPTDANMGKNWFSLSELNQRLQKLRDIEEKESASSIGGVTFADLRSSLSSLQHDADEKTKKSSRQKLDILGHLGGTPSYMLSPPKEQLVEKFFHPDNMSSAEKLKLELKKARDEFKVSESDCGSSRVQVAQLTIKIKHLSSVLHKKDKHSRKGLQEMVQKRKKHLRYLRRTDWDSYCFCLSKLGLRDNPDYKN